MKIKFNFEFIQNDNTKQGVLIINKTIGKQPIYDIRSNSEVNITLLNEVVKLYTESRVYEIFTSARRNNDILTCEEYKKILIHEVPENIISSVLQEMKYCIHQDEYQQAS
ncbi:hypothetical protein KMW28_16180 [Flammeovirga yaeyamensis]|uniref:Uncharacterized protein n=1 Tax=Flammeovirga yaeyamensis TaxID=367791 RepID=A0AAX1N0T2_9BACT|nr:MULTISPECIES: hypothetical protein [Flammeovirga]ANQ47406.1 hypothetical protein MY04_0023 [Flammeovirga sp. MY04]MBB3698452.1 hypothetical protein [Flammeovirga yaeyamensis]NMF34199.1 hypothetical protein [Flammeovirga yaeyamensis]QWG01184.1 hypothetical protein KMW28_16180 [Flammeovirga yaeyamensis]